MQDQTGPKWLGGWGWDNCVGNPSNAGNVTKPWSLYLYACMMFEK